MEGLDHTQFAAKEDEVYKLIKNEYRMYFTAKFERTVLANVPNYMILDDHEVKNQWSWLPEDVDPTTLDYWHGQLCKRAYLEYQRNLREDINENTSNDEFYFETHNEIGIWMGDQRAHRAWNRVGNGENDSLMGDAQWKKFDQVFSSANDLKTIIAVF